jgi:hypothetical protein
MRLISLALMGLTLLTQAAQADVVYDSIPAPLPTNVTSLGYEATSTAEFGDAVTLAGTARALTRATVVMSNWALESTYEAVGTSAGYFVPLTFSLYNFGGAGPNPVVGSLIASKTVNAFIAWRPEASLSCTGGTFQAPDGCFSGLASLVTFDFNGESLPNNVIFGLAFNTTDHGYAPTGVPGPYNSLNFGLAGSAANPGVPSVGTDVNPDGLEWNTSFPGFLTTGVAGTFGPDTDWTPYLPAVRLEAVPEPASVALLGAGILGLGAARRRNQATKRA